MNFRNFDEINKKIENNYALTRKFHTVSFVQKLQKKYLRFNDKMEIWDIITNLETFVDVSDPDFCLPNKYHCFQTAEKIRNDNQEEWLIVVGLIHDLGKILYKKGIDEDGTSMENQFSIVGDTFMVGCKIPSTIVYSKYNRDNNDHIQYQNTPYGIYKPNIGLDNMISSFGHDEYLYQILKDEKNKNCLPEQALYVIRYHSMYVHHQDRAYKIFESKKDLQYLKYLQLFSKYDLYSKCNEELEIDYIYYKNLIRKYFKNSYLMI